MMRDLALIVGYTLLSCAIVAMAVAIFAVGHAMFHWSASFHFLASRRCLVQREPDGIVVVLFNWQGSLVEARGVSLEDAVREAMRVEERLAKPPTVYHTPAQTPG